MAGDTSPQSNSTVNSSSGSRPKGSRWLLLGIMAAVAVWGSVLALGALLFGYDQATGEIHYAPNPVRGAIVLASVAVFLAGWGILLRSAKR